MTPRESMRATFSGSHFERASTFSLQQPSAFLELRRTAQKSVELSIFSRHLTETNRALAYHGICSFSTVPSLRHFSFSFLLSNDASRSTAGEVRIMLHLIKRKREAKWLRVS